MRLCVRVKREALYRDYVTSFIQSPFAVPSFRERVERQALLIRQYAISEVQGYTFLAAPSVFDQAITDLKQHVQNRHDAVNAFLGK